MQRTIYKMKFRGVSASLSGFANRFWTRPINNVGDYEKILSGRRALEIGGPSEVFTDKGCLPVYRILDRIDNLNFSQADYWHGEFGAEYKFHPSKSPGKLLFREGGGDLNDLRGKYDVVMSSNVIEHFANPIRSVKQWMTIVGPGGYVLTVTPEKNDWIDHSRELTSWEHLLDDYQQDIGEDDLAHLEDCLKHTDRMLLPRHQVTVFDQSCKENLKTRFMHHHTWNTALVIKLHQFCGLELVAVDKQFPTSIITLARVPA